MATIIRPAPIPATLKSTRDAYDREHRAFKAGMSILVENAGTGKDGAPIFTAKIGRSWWHLRADQIEILDRSVEEKAANLGALWNSALDDRETVAVSHTKIAADAVALDGTGDAFLRVMAGGSEERFAISAVRRAKGGK